MMSFALGFNVIGFFYGTPTSLEIDHHFLNAASSRLICVSVLLFLLNQISEGQSVMVVESDKVFSFSFTFNMIAF